MIRYPMITLDVSLHLVTVVNYSLRITYFNASYIICQNMCIPSESVFLDNWMKFSHSLLISNYFFYFSLILVIVKCV
jgi:hypothetical protein